MTVSRTSAVIGRRACAALAATSAVLHAAMIGRGFAAVLTVATATTLAVVEATVAALVLYVRTRDAGSILSRQ